MVEGTPQVVEKEVTKVVEVEKVVTATPEPEAGEAEEAPLVRAEEQVLRVAHAYSWRWDPATASGTDFQVGMNTFFAGLLEVNKEGEMVPFAAEKVDVSEDGKTYTYTLRDGLKFGPTGTPVTAADVKWSWERSLQAGSMAYDPLKNVKGFQAFVNEEADELTGLTAVDDRTFVVEFEVYDTLWWERQGHPALMIVEQAQIERGSPEHHWAETGGGGVGRYVIEEINMDEQWAWLVKNPYFWGENNGPDRIYVARVADEQARLLMYETGELDIIFVSGGILRSLNQPNHPLQDELIRVDAQGFSNLIMRADREPFDDPKMREAIYYSIDYQGILNNVYGGAYPVMNANAGRFGGYGEVIKDWPPMAQDAERALQAFQDSSYAGDATKVPTIRLYSSTASDVRLFVQAMQENIRDILGVNVELILSDNPLRPEEQETEQWQAWSHAPLTYEPGEELYQLWACDGGWNADWGHWCDEEMTAIMKEADQTIDSDKRYQLYAQADQILLDAHVNILQWWQTNYFLAKPYVQEVKFGNKSPMIFNWEEIWIAE
jgi:ABC-type transport system substrate-binding protein